MKTKDIKHIYLAGFMGTGKSAVGKALAARLKRPFVDLDARVAKRAGMSVRDIFRTEGEGIFREYETKTLAEVAARSRSVIALGGGTPTIEANAATLRRTGAVILLTADWPTLFERVQDSQARPLLDPAISADGDSPLFDDFVAHAEPILEERMDVYEQVADLTIDTSDLEIEEVVSQIESALRENRWL